MADPWSEWASQVEGSLFQSRESLICSNYQKHFLTKQGTACMCLRIPVLSTKQAAVERSASQFICHQRKVLLASLLGFWIRSRSKRGIFLFDLLPNHRSAGAMGMKNSLKILSRYVLFGDQMYYSQCLLSLQRDSCGAGCEEGRDSSPSPPATDLSGSITLACALCIRAPELPAHPTPPSRRRWEHSWLGWWGRLFLTAVNSPSKEQTSC